MTKTETIGTIDLTPTWSGMLMTLLAIYENSNAKGRKTALEELQRMAAVADMTVAAQKKEKA